MILLCQLLKLLTSAMLLLCTETGHIRIYKPQVMVTSCVDLYVFLGCFLPIQPPLKSLTRTLKIVIKSTFEIFNKHMQYCIRGYFHTSIFS